MKKFYNVIHFGSGNIGKGLVFPVLWSSKQITSFTFVDINSKSIEDLNSSNKYEINYITKKEVVKKEVTGYKALHLDQLFDSENLQILEGVDIITTSVGKKNLSHLTKTFTKIFEKNPSKKFLVMCCENGNRISSLFSKEFNYSNVAFVDCLVDRIVPIQKNIQSNVIFVEDYFSWLCDQNQWPKEWDYIKSISYNDKIEKDIYRKMCLLNGIHCSIAWYSKSVLGQINDMNTFDVLKNKTIKNFAQKLAKEICFVISHKFQTPYEDSFNYFQKCLLRFQNSNLPDDLIRIGRNPIQKLKSDERIVDPLLYALKNNLEFDNLLHSFKCGITFDEASDSQSLEIKKAILHNGIEFIMSDLLKFDESTKCKFLKIY